MDSEHVHFCTNCDSFLDAISALYCSNCLQRGPALSDPPRPRAARAGARRACVRARIARHSGDGMSAAADLAPIFPDTPIRYTDGPLDVYGADACVYPGDLGRYLGPAPDDGWHYTEPAEHPGKVCPVSRGMIEPAA